MTFLWERTHSSCSNNLPCRSNEATLWPWQPLKSWTIEWPLQAIDQEGSFCKFCLLELGILVFSRCLCHKFFPLYKDPSAWKNKSDQFFKSQKFLWEQSLFFELSFDSKSMFCENYLCSLHFFVFFMIKKKEKENLWEVQTASLNTLLQWVW